MNAKRKLPIVTFWFRRDLRIEDNTGLFHALSSGLTVLPIFIFDRNILKKLSDPKDQRISFIYQEVVALNAELEQKFNSSLRIIYATPVQAFETLLHEFDVKGVYANEDYEPYAIQRDLAIEKVLGANQVVFKQYKDHVLFAKDEILKQNGDPYSKFTPYRRRWMERLAQTRVQILDVTKIAVTFYHGHIVPAPTIEDLGFTNADFLRVPARSVSEAKLKDYEFTRNFPAKQGTSLLGVHLRFGTISIRKLIAQARQQSDIFLNELIWREFLQQILWHFPRVVNQSFKSKYDAIQWRNNEVEFDKWCHGQTGYALVDAGMRELEATGHMHNRVRMVVASFLTKDLLIDWRWGEAWFADKLLDYELASNNGNWQWAAGTGCDAAPYFRIFNPDTQLKKFDPTGAYIRQWVPEYGTSAYAQPIVDHGEARLRALKAYAAASPES
jgi:deoxyribodipyrimidine photo-lyase